MLKGYPEKKNINKECPQPYSVGYENIIPEIKGFNQAVNLFTQEILKRSEIEEIKKVVRNNDAWHCILRYCENQENLPYGKSIEVLEELAQAISKLFRTGE